MVPPVVAQETTSTGLLRVVRDVLFYGLGNVAGRALALLVLPLLTLVLTPADFGRLAVLTLLSVIGRATLGLGLQGAAGIVLQEQPSRRDMGAAISTSVVLSVLQAAVLIGVAWLAGDRIAELLGLSGDGLLVQLTAVSLGTQLVGEVLCVGLQHTDRARPYAASVFVSAVVGTATGLGLVYIMRLGLIGWVWGQLVQSLALLALAVPISARSLTRPRLSLVRPLVSHGVPLMPGNLLTLGVQYSGHGVLFLTHSVELLGIYNLGYSLGMAMSMLTSAFSTAWQPYFLSFLKRGKEEGQVPFQWIGIGYAFGFGLVALAFFAVARPLVLLLTNPAFAEAYKFVGIVAAAQWCAGLWWVLSPGMFLSKETWLLPIIQAISLLCALAFGFTGALCFGPNLAPLSFIAGSVSLVLLQLCVNFWRRYPVPVFDGRRIASMVLLVLGFGFLQRVIDSQLSPFLGAVASAGELVSFVAIGWRLLAPTERDACHRVLLRVLPRRREGA